VCGGRTLVRDDSESTLRADEEHRGPHFTDNDEIVAERSRVSRIVSTQHTGSFLGQPLQNLVTYFYSSFPSPDPSSSSLVVQAVGRVSNPTWVRAGGMRCCCCCSAAAAAALLLLLLLLCLRVEGVDAQSNVDNLLLETFLLVCNMSAPALIGGGAALATRCCCRWGLPLGCCSGKWRSKYRTD